MRLKIISGFGLIILMFLAFWSFFGFESSEDPVSAIPQNRAAGNSTRRTWFEADEVILEEHLQGEKILAGRIESLRMRKKKIGFISFSLLHMLEGRHVTIDLYESGNAGIDIRELRRRFVNLLLPGNTKHKTGAIGLADISINFFRDQTKQASLYAAYSTVAPEENDIIFTGNVTLTSEDKRLDCREIKWDGASGRFLSKGTFFLRAKGRVFQGRGLNTDHLLLDISP